MDGGGGNFVQVWVYVMYEVWCVGNIVVIVFDWIDVGVVVIIGFDQVVEGLQIIGVDGEVWCVIVVYILF